MKQRWIIYAVLGIFLASCYQEENVTGEVAQPKYQVEDSDDPVDHYIYEFYQNYGSFILYRYTDIDYLWNMSGLLDMYMVRQEDKTVLNEGLQYMEKVFFRYYTDEFKKHYFPFKMMMCDSLQITRSGKLYADEVAGAGLSFLGIGKIREGIGEISADSLKVWKGQIHGTFWADFLYDNEMLKLSDVFWNISDAYYGVNLLNLEENEGLEAEDVDPKIYGFWDRDREAEIAKTYCMAPKQTLDVYQFIRMITTHTAAEMERMIAPYNKLKDKYYMLVNELKEVYGVDIQAIGDDRSL